MAKMAAKTTTAKRSQNGGNTGSTRRNGEKFVNFVNFIVSRQLPVSGCQLSVAGRLALALALALRFIGTTGKPLAVMAETV
jgi:hypothetical protein